LEIRIAKIVRFGGFTQLRMALRLSEKADPGETLRGLARYHELPADFYKNL
jgi:hypothetical protein